jgi:hypothetical protein
MSSPFVIIRLKRPLRPSRVWNRTLAALNAPDWTSRGTTPVAKSIVPGREAAGWLGAGAEVGVVVREGLVLGGGSVV